MIATFVDGEAEKLVEEAYTEMIYDFPRMQVMMEITFLRQKVRRLEAEQSLAFPHRQVKIGSANIAERTATALEIQSFFQDQSQWLQQIRMINFDTLPGSTTVPAQVELVTNLPIYLVVHLFSGRRRGTDLHACLEAFATEMGFRVADPFIRHSCFRILWEFAAGASYMEASSPPLSSWSRCSDYGGVSV